MLCCIQKYVKITEEGNTYIHVWFDGANVSFHVEFVWNNNNNNNKLSVSIPSADEWQVPHLFDKQCWNEGGGEWA